MAEPPHTPSLVSLTREGPVGVVHLHRAPVNCYDRTFIDELNDAIDSIRFDESLRAGLVTSDVRGFFSAGADITMLRTSTDSIRAMTLLHMHEVLQKIERTPKIFVAAIGGHALGGGLEIALACDLRFAAEGDYRLGLPEVTLGIIPGNGGTQRLQRLIGGSKALDLMVTGKPVSPQRAAELGLVDRLVPAERLLEEAEQYLRELAAGPGEAIGRIKVTAKAGAELPLDGALELERAAMWGVCMTGDAAEGMSAFAEKRKPQWKLG